MTKKPTTFDNKRGRRPRSKPYPTLQTESDRIKMDEEYQVDDATAFAENEYSDDLGFAHSERIVVTPSLSLPRDNDFVWTDVRVESQSRVRTVSSLQGISTVSPFPKSVVQVLRNHKALNIRLQVNNLADSQYPKSLLDDVSHWSDGTIQSPPLSAPAGVSVTAQFQVSPDDCNDLSQTLHDKFQSLLQEIVGRRILLAPLITVAQHYQHGSMSGKQSPPRYWHMEPIVHSNIQTTMTYNTSVWQVSTNLPMEGSPLASEGLWAFAQLSPCQGDLAGLWSLSSPTRWSNILLGTDTPFVKNNETGPVFPPPQQRRSLMLDLGASPSCYTDHSADSCDWTLWQGLQYSTRIPIDQPVTLSHLLPEPRKRHRNQLRTCPFADFSSVHLVLPKVEDPSSTKQLPWTSSAFSACSRVSANSQANDSAHLDRVSLELSETTEISEPCFSITQPPISAVLSKATTTKRSQWSVELDILRRQGLANRGTLVSTVRNEDPKCAVSISLVQSIPMVIDPVWRSLSVRIYHLDADEINGVLPEGRNIPWTSIAGQDIDFGGQDPSKSIILSFDRLDLPPSSIVQLALDYEPAFLPFEAFPSDPNRGFEMPPVRVRFDTSLHGCGMGGPRYLFSNAVLLLAPVPDMSMPFNVLSLTCSLYVFVVGSLLNLLVRKASETVKYKLYPSKKPQSKLKIKLNAAKTRIREKVAAFRSARENQEGHQKMD